MRWLLHRLVLYGFHLFIARPILHGIVGVRYRRRQRVPEGPCLVVSNHNSHLDAAVLMTMFPLRRLPWVHPVAAADYFGTHWFRRGLALACMNGIPIDRRPPRGKDPLAPLVDGLKSGHSLVFFPEGSRGEAGVVAPFRRGVGLLVRELPGLLVVPVFLSGPERAWPRGQVPVPMSIDAHIGRPRTYPADEDPKVLAEMVRQDVLALAPPPPPLPGQRHAPPARISICSVDTERKTEVFRRVTEALGRQQRTLGVSEPVLEADPDGMRESTGPIAYGRARPWLRLLAWTFRTRLFRGEAFVEMVERAQINEALGHARDLRFVVVEGSALVDLLAWQVAAAGPNGLGERELHRLLDYLTGKEQIPVGSTWQFIRNAPEIWLMHNLDLARPPIPELLVVLDVSVAGLMRRLRSRGRKLTPYDNMEFLERLQQAYSTVAGLLRREHGVEVVELDEQASPEADAERVVDYCEELSAPAETGA